MTNNLSPQMKRMVRDCIAMLETYYDKVASSNEAITLQGADRTAWLDHYRPTLVLNGPCIPDDKFFFPDGSHPNYGIGDDAAANKFDFCSFLYHCYQLVLNLSPANPAIASLLRNPVSCLVFDCFMTLDPYVEQIRRDPFGSVRGFTGDDMKKWKEQYYPGLVKANIIPDGTFFGAANDSVYGIGSDGMFNGGELMHFLYECQRYLYKKLQP